MKIMENVNVKELHEWYWHQQGAELYLGSLNGIVSELRGL